MPLDIFASGRDDPCWSPQAEGSADRQSIACRADRCVRPFTPPPQREWISPNGTLWNASLGLLRLDPGELHDLAPLFRFIRDHFSEISRRPPSSLKRAFILGSASPALISLFSLSTISAGVLFGAPMPHQTVDSY